MAMGRMGDRKRRLLGKFLGGLLLLLSMRLAFCGNANYTITYEPGQLDAMQAIWGEWNASTPRPQDNLAGWNSTQQKPCNLALADNKINWRGVQCLTDIACALKNSTEGRNCPACIIGLSLSNASISGTLPPEIGNITTLSTLELTGNPELTGPLPMELDTTYLHMLDLHNNSFTGDIPEFKNIWFLVTLDLSGNQFTGPMPFIQMRMKALQTLNLARNTFSGNIPNGVFENMTQLTTLDLSENLFTGLVPNLTMVQSLSFVNLSRNSFTGCTGSTGSFELSSVFNSRFAKFLSVLDLSSNRLTGCLTEWNVSELGTLEEVYLDDNFINGTLCIRTLSETVLVRRKSLEGRGSLKILSIRNNNITSVTYDTESIEDITTIFRLQGNPYCNARIQDDDGWRCFCQQVCKITRGGPNSRRIIVISAVASTLSVLVVLGIGFAVIIHRNGKYKRYILLQVQKKFEEFDVKPTIFSYNELRAATQDFHPKMKLGQGSYGAVYKGILDNGHNVAVKQLFAKPTQGIDEFLNEVVLITGMKHRNLVNLKGCCLREDQRLLVYEYVDNLDIDQILLGPNKANVSWPVRLKICQGVAHGLHYLHALAQPRVIHRDIKASNVLLDKNYEARIADFGLALLFPDEESHIMTIHVAGTKGYLAPEYATLGQLSDKVDVFSFGVLCLEVISGRRNIDQKLPQKKMYLSKWAWELHGNQGNLLDLVDPTLILQDEEKPRVQRMIKIALLCLQDAPEQRPTMARVVAMLHGDIDSEVVVLSPGKDEKYLESLRVAAFVDNVYATVKEEGDFSFVKSISRRGGSCERSSTTDTRIELSDLIGR
ncbi:hypothetical protein M758_9G065600 [Ceratodon purpureus]|nr:hypothetical protein M758_9G065600 [Ceratodon purpureus]